MYIKTSVFCFDRIFYNHWQLRWQVSIEACKDMPEFGSFLKNVKVFLSLPYLNIQFSIRPVRWKNSKDMLWLGNLRPWSYTSFCLRILSKSKHWASPRQRVFWINPAANITFPLSHCYHILYYKWKMKMSAIRGGGGLGKCHNFSILGGHFPLYMTV